VSAAVSKDGTRIGYTRLGSGPPVVLVDGALCHRAFGPLTAVAKELAPAFSVYTYDRRGRGESGSTPFEPAREIEDLEAVIREAGGSACVCGVSSGAALALDAATRGLAIERLALYEPPFIVDDTRAPITDADARRMRQHIDDGEHGAAVALFMRLVGVPRMGIVMMRLMPMWSKLKAVAPTLPHDLALTVPRQAGQPLSQTEWASVAAPTVVIAGGRSPAWMRNGNAALAAVIPGATHHVLPGQTHMVKAKVLAPFVAGFFRARLGHASA
jgi:pimeloyl-ACP methyl ester carboxylesterase